MQHSFDRTDEARDARVVALGNYVDSLRAKMDAQDAVVDAVGKVHESEAEVINVLVEGIRELTSRMDGFDNKLDGIRDDIGLVRGGHARNAMRQNLGRIVDHFGFRLISPVPQEAVIAFSKAAADQGNAFSAVESFGNADMVMNVLDSDGKPAYITLEASFTVASNDIRRAIRNAGYLKTLTGLSTYAAVAGVQILPEAQAEIDAGQAFFYQIPARELQSE